MSQQSHSHEQKDKETEELFSKYKQTYLTVTCQDKMNCSFDKWYKQFRKQTIRSRIIPVNDTFIKYLKQDGLKLPPQIQNEMDNYYELDSDNDSDYNNDENFNNEDIKQNNNNTIDDNENNKINYSKLNDLFSKIRDKISALKNAVVPKLNWSCPSDAKWINTESLKCENITQILLLLKSSQFIQHDLYYPFHGCIDYKNDNNNNKHIEYKLILRKYCNLYPNREFRCFIYNHAIIAITQRMDYDCYNELQNKEIRNKIKKSICDLFKMFIENKFENNNYVLDVYVDKEYKCYIIDFNPFYEFTDCGALFSWIDICKLIENRSDSGNDEKKNEEEMIVFGFVDKQHSKIRFNPNSQYRYPIDAVDLSNEKNIQQFVDSCRNENK